MSIGQVTAYLGNSDDALEGTECNDVKDAARVLYEGKV
jgi:hypothetical protein